MDTTLAQSLTNEQLDQLTNLLTDPNVAAGPWIADSHEIYRADASGYVQIDEWVGETCAVELPDSGAANAALIVAARNALPALIAELRYLRDENEHLRGYIVTAAKITRDRDATPEDLIAELDELFNG